MHISYSLHHPLTTDPVVLTIGKFDGVHRGHQHLVRTVVERAQSQGMRSAVLTFDPHPTTVLRPEQEYYLLTSLEERVALLAELGPDCLIIAPFNRETMGTPAYAYMRQVCTAVPLRELWVGEHFALGRQREGNIPQLRELGAELGYTVHIVAPLLVAGERVASSQVRDLLREGQVEAVFPLLGRHFSVQGVVEEGDKRGQTIGFPTANLTIHNHHVLPADGVYACYAMVGEQRIPAVTNVGVRPTFGGLNRTVEAHLLDWSGNLYGQVLRLEFWQRLRGERKFANVQELIAQIGRDAEQARAMLRDA